MGPVPSLSPWPLALWSCGRGAVEECSFNCRCALRRHFKLLISLVVYYYKILKVWPMVCSRRGDGVHDFQWWVTASLCQALYKRVAQAAQIASARTGLTECFCLTEVPRQQLAQTSGVGDLSGAPSLIQPLWGAGWRCSQSKRL